MEFAGPQVEIDFGDCSHDMKRNVMTVFRGMGTDCTQITMINAHHYPFPVKAADEYLRKHPEKVRSVTELNLEFNRRNTVQILEMVRKRFPSIKTLKLSHSFTHPIEHALGQYAQMPNLETLHFGYNVNQLAEHARTNDLTPLPQVKSLFCCVVELDDTFENFEATLSIIFPNLENLHYPSPSEEFVERIYANAKRLFPKIKFCNVVDSSDISEIVHEQGKPQFPIKVSESFD